MNIAIIDDNAKDLQRVFQLTDSFFYNSNIDYHIVTQETVKDIILQCFDIVLLDIDMPDCDGIEFARQYLHKCKDSKVIFITNRSDRVFDSFKIHPYDFIQKNNIDKELPVTLKQIINEEKSLSIYAHGIHYQIPLYQIVYCESFDHYCSIHLSNETIQAKMRLCDLSSNLPISDFIQVHKSYIINISKVTRYSNQNIYLGSIAIPMSKSRRKNVMNRLEGNKI